MNVVISRGGLASEAKADGGRNPSVALLYGPELATASAAGDPIQPMNALAETEPSPEQLAQRCQAGCPESFEQLVRRYESQIFNFLRQFTRNEQDAEDLTQVTFIKAHRSLHRYTPSLAFAPWLFIIARRTAASHFRTAKQFEELPIDREGSEENPATALETKDEQTSLWKLVRTLKPKQAEAVWLHYAEGFSVAETARIMQTNRVYVKVLLHRARTNLFRVLAARGPKLKK